jgi:UDP-glucose:(heptosyl)LPS alpha-1,3-glucosyltransferase
MVREEILSHYRVDPSKIEVVHNGVEWNELQNDFQVWPEEKERLAKELNISPSSYHFVFIGHNFRRKGLDNLLEALPLLNSKEFHLTVVGKDKNIAHYQSLARKLKLDQHVRFEGPRSDTRRFYQLADALVIPSHYDPFANVTVEALAMGVRVISSLSNGGHEVLTEENGIKIASLDKKEAIAFALQTAMAQIKTKESAEKIRASCSSLDFSSQLSFITDRCLA